MPMFSPKSCRYGKVRYRDHREAVSALHGIVVARRRAAFEMVACRRREVRSYDCDQCQGVHLTSKAA